MEKLELKHLAPFLPYGLKYATLSDDDNKYYLHHKHNTITVDGSQNNITNICLVDYSRSLYKPILRPLSDLTKEIEHNGERFVPINEIKNSEYYSHYELEDFVRNSFSYGSLNSLSYELITKLLEWHFDVFGLIDKGLAIDINTIK